MVRFHSVERSKWRVNITHQQAQLPHELKHHNRSGQTRETQHEIAQRTAAPACQQPHMAYDMGIEPRHVQAASCTTLQWCRPYYASLGWLDLSVSVIPGGMSRYAITSPVFIPGPVEPRYDRTLGFEGISVDRTTGQQLYLNATLAYKVTQQLKLHVTCRADIKSTYRIVSTSCHVMGRIGLWCFSDVVWCYVMWCHAMRRIELWCFSFNLSDVMWFHVVAFIMWCDVACVARMRVWTQSSIWKNSDTLENKVTACVRSVMISSHKCACQAWTHAAYTGISCTCAVSVFCSLVRSLGCTCVSAIPIILMSNYVMRLCHVLPCIMCHVSCVLCMSLLAYIILGTAPVEGDSSYHMTWHNICLCLECRHVHIVRLSISRRGRTRVWWMLCCVVLCMVLCCFWLLRSC